MSSSDPAPLKIIDRVRETEAALHPGAIAHHPSWRRRWKIRVAAALLWVHIYLSMFGLAVILFFGVTGITLNHPDWFFSGAESTSQHEGTVDLRWIEPPSPTTGDAPADPEAGVDKLAVVEHLRAEHEVRGALADFTVDDYECLVSFRGPGYAADAIIDRETGRYTLSATYHGVVAVLNDLHKGRDTGPAWSLVIDISAALMTLVALSGFGLIFYLRLRRGAGLVLALLGAVVVAAIVWLWVP